MRYAFNTDYFACSLSNYIDNRPLREVAEDVHISASTLSRVLRGGKPDIDTFAMLCGHMRIDPKDFFFDEDTEFE